MRPLSSLLLVVVLALAACGTGDPSVAAIVNDETIPLSEVRETFDAAQADPQVAQQLEADTEGQGAQQLQAQIVGQLIQAEVISQAAAELGVEVSDEDVQARLDELLQEAGGGAEALPQVLQQQQAFGEADLRLRLRLNALLQEVEEALTGDLAITDEDVATFYEEDPQGQFGETASVRAIVVETEQAAQDAIDRLEAGEDFAEVAAEVSIDPSGQQGGELPAVQRGQLPPELDEVIFAAEPGDILGPLPVQQVFVVLEVTERGERPPLEDVADDIRGQLEEQQRQDVVGQWINQAFLEAEVEVNPRFGEWVPEQAAVQAVDPLGELQPAEGETPADAPLGEPPAQQPPAEQPAPTDASS